MRLAAFVLLIFFSSEVQAAITKLLNKRRVVVIDDSDVSKGDKVCFYSASGRKRACGKVVKVKEDKSYVRVKSKKRFRRLKKGMTHEVDGGGGRGGAAGGHSFIFRLLYTPGLMARSQFNYLNTIEEGENTDGPFLPLSDARVAENDQIESWLARRFPWGSGGAEGEIFITPTMSIAMGGRWTLINTSPRATVDILKEGSDEHYSSEYKSHEINFWLDFFLLHVPDFDLRLALGGEFTMSSVSIDTTRMRDETVSDRVVVEKIVTEDAFVGKSSASVASVRFSARKDFSMGVYGLGLGVTAIISPLTISSSFKLDGEPRDSELLEEYGNDKEKMVADIEAALEHGHHVFSLVLGLSFYLGV